MWANLGQAVRSLTRHPTFVAIAALVLALGIGLNSAVFSIVYALLFRPLPVESAKDLISVYMVSPKQPDRPFVPHHAVLDSLRLPNDVFTDVTAHSPTPYVMRADGETDALDGERVLSNYFQVLGVRPAMGRVLVASDDDLATTERAVVISHGAWTRRFHSDPAIVGKRIVVALAWGQVDMPATVVGVTGPEFKGIGEPWKPTHMWISYAHGGDRPQRAVTGLVIGRLKPGVTIEQAQPRVEALATHATIGVFARGSEPHYVLYRTNDVRVPADPAAAVVPKRLAAAMMIVVAMVLLVAATNIVGVLLARGVERAREIAIRRVAGATPLRILQQLLAESVILSFLGGLLGLAVAPSLLGVFRAVTPAQFALEVGIDLPVVLFVISVCAVVGILVGILPARQAMRSDVLPWLGNTQFGGSKLLRARLRYAITIPQVAVSLALVLVSATYVRGLLRVELTSLGYVQDNLLVANPVLRATGGERPQAKPDALVEERRAEQNRSFYRQLLARLQVLPGTTAAAISDVLPLREPPERPEWFARSQDELAPAASTDVAIERSSVSPGYFRTLGMTLLAGRDFDERDTRAAPKVTIVSAAMAERLWPGGGAVGRTLIIKNAWDAKAQTERYEVVGVVSDVRPILHDGDRRRFVYLALGQAWRPSSDNVLVRAAGESGALIPSLKAAVASADPMADLSRTRYLSHAIAEVLFPRRLAAGVLVASGIMALSLALLGVYGVMSYSVAQRTSEIGVRLALGADRRGIERLLLREGALVAGAGSISGLALGYAAIRIASNGYSSVPPLDAPITLMTLALLTGAVALASYLPARRAASADPVEALRRP